MWSSSKSIIDGNPGQPACRLVSARGFSLVEMIVMLSVLSILVGSMVPVVWDSVATAREIRAKNDVTQIAAALVNFQRDLGVGGFVRSGRAWRSDLAARDLASLLVSRGDALRAQNPSAAGWMDMGGDQMEDHLHFNLRAYPLSRAGLGVAWRGPYLSSELGADPWGSRYMVNSWCLVPAAQRGAASDCAVFVISGGPNRSIETPFEQPVVYARVLGDDIAVRIQ